nr:uncharacterized protein LOC113460491 [Zonotrichia albicollis]
MQGKSQQEGKVVWLSKGCTATPHPALEPQGSITEVLQPCPSKKSFKAVHTELPTELGSFLGAHPLLHLGSTLLAAFWTFKAKPGWERGEGTDLRAQLLLTLLCVPAGLRGLALPAGGEAFLGAGTAGHWLGQGCGEALGVQDGLGWGAELSPAALAGSGPWGGSGCSGWAGLGWVWVQSCPQQHWGGSGWVGFGVQSCPQQHWLGQGHGEGLGVQNGLGWAGFGVQSCPQQHPTAGRSTSMPLSQGALGAALPGCSAGVPRDAAGVPRDAAAVQGCPGMQQQCRDDAGQPPWLSSSLCPGFHLLCPAGGFCVFVLALSNLPCSKAAAALPTLCLRLFLLKSQAVSVLTEPGVGSEPGQLVCWCGGSQGAG